MTASSSPTIQWPARPDTTHGRREPTDGTRLLLQELEQAFVEREKAGPVSLRAWVDLAEAWHITRALDACGGNRTAAARRLGIGRRTLYAKMDKLGISARWSIEPL